MSDVVEKVVIIGSGPAGLTAAIYASRANLHPLIIEGDRPGGQLMGTTAVENWPGTASIMGPQLMFDMKAHAEKFGTRFVPERIAGVDFSQYPFLLTTDKQHHIKASSIIIATGASPKKLNVPGEQEFWGKGVTTCAVCDGAFFANKPVVIVGGGDTAMENASFMAKFTDNITVIHLLDTLTASAAMQERVLTNPKIKIHYNSSVTEIKGDVNGVTGITLLNKKTNATSTLATNAVFIAIGFNPNTDIFNEHIELDKGGYIKVTDHTHTSVEGVFVAGDVADFRYRQAVTSAGSGCMAALDAERWLRDKS